MFQELTRSFVKSAKVVEKEGIPSFYIKELAELDDYIKLVWEDKDFKKKLSRDRSKGLTTIRQRLKRYFNDVETAHINKRVEDYRLNPEASDEEVEVVKVESDVSSDEEIVSSDDEESDDESEGDDQQKGKWAGSDSEGESDWVPSDSSPSSDDEQLIEGGAPDPDNIFSRYTIAYFLRKPDDGQKKKTTVKRIKKDKDGREKIDKKGDEHAWTEVSQGPNRDMTIDEVTGRVSIFAKEVDVNAKNVIQKLAEINTGRPRKETDRKNKVLFLKRLHEHIEESKLGLGLGMKVRLSIISALYEYNPKHKDYMGDEAFQNVLIETQTLIDTLMSNQDIIIMREDIQDDDESNTDKPNADGKWHVRGSLVNTCTKMDTEFFKLLQNSDQHSEEYRGRLRSNEALVKILKTGVEWAEDQPDQQQRCQMYLLVIKYIYYRHSSQCGGVANAEVTMDKYCKFIYTHDETQRIRTQAILYNIYHLALHDKWFQARDLMLMSHLQESIHNADIGTQIIYNRTMVQLGLCAFRKGQMEDAHQALTDIQSGNRARELLAQGMS